MIDLETVKARTRQEDLNPKHPDYKSSALIAGQPPKNAGET